MTTYQHRPFIRQALESALTQEASFPFELCIGEDDSTDGTREICLEYAERYPNRIRLFLRDRKDVISIGGRPTGRYNLIETLRASRGRYIALLEGDDYWTSPHKLQKQFDVLEHDSTTSLCAHDVHIINETARENGAAHRRTPRGSVVPLDELLEEMLLPTASLFFRRWEDWSFPPWFYSLPMGDWPLVILCALRGKVVFLQEKMAAYRQHPRGYWSSQEEVDQVLGRAKFYEAMLGFLGEPYRKQIKRLFLQAKLRHEYLRNHLWRSRYYKYLLAWYAGPRVLLRESMLTLSRVRNRVLGSRFDGST